MKYNYALFKTTKELSKRTKYQYRIASAFYNVYSDGEGDYHMDIQDKASIEERIWFYQNRILGLKNYPLVSYPKFNGKENCNLLMEQVIGLPDEVMRGVDSSGNQVSLTPNEILHRIHFEKGLFYGVGVSDFRSDILDSDDYSVTHLINLLMEKGFYFLNPERIYSSNRREEEIFYPVFVDERKVPDWMKNRKVSADELLMDFCPLLSGMEIDKDSFLNYFKPISDMSFSELADYAFVRNINQLQGLEQKSHLMVRQYFYALLKKLMNEIYESFGMSSHLFGYTVLDSDFHSGCLANSHVDYGQNFRMVSYSFRIIEKKDGVLTEKTENKPCFCPWDKKYIIRTYDFIHQAFFNGVTKQGLIPSLYLKLMGMPSKALEFVKYFDFEQGKGKDFVKQLPFLENAPDFFRDAGFSGTCLRSDGTLFYRHESFREAICVSNHPELGIFISEPGCLYDDLSIYFYGQLRMVFYFRSYLKENPFLLSKTYLSLVDKIEARMNDNGIPMEQLEQVKAFVLEDGASKNMNVFSEYVLLLQDGYSTDEAYAAMAGRFALSYNEVLLLLLGAIREYIRSKIPDVMFEESWKEEQTLLLMNRNLDYLLDGVHGRMAFLGRNFIGYLLPEENGLVLDESDYLPLKNLIEIYHRYFQNKKNFRFSSYSLSSCVYEKQAGFSSLIEFLGLPISMAENLNPRKDILSQIKFVPDIGILNKEYQNVIAEDIRLMELYLVHVSLGQGVYLIEGEPDVQGCFVYALEEQLSPLLKRFLSPLFQQLFLIAAFYDEHQKIEKKDFFRSSSSFRNEVMPYIIGGKKAKADSLFHRYSFNLLSMFARDTILDILSERYLYDEKVCGYVHDFSFFAKEGDVYLSMGESFFAYSRTGELQDYALRKTDLDALLFSVNASLYSYAEEKKEEQIRLAVVASGIPYFFMTDLYSLLKKKKKGELVTKEELLVSLPFTDDTYQEMPFALYKGPIFYIRNKDIVFDYANNMVINSLLHQGMYVRNDNLTFIHAFDETDAELNVLNEDMKQSHLELDETVLSGPAKEFLAPEDTCFIFLVGDFIRNRISKNISKNTLFFVQEFLFYLYDKDPLFVVHYLNQNKEKEENPLSSEYAAFQIRPISKRVREEETIYYLNLFVLSLLRKTYEKTLKLILKQKSK